MLKCDSRESTAASSNTLSSIFVRPERSRQQTGQDNDNRGKTKAARGPTRQRASIEYRHIDTFAAQKARRVRKIRPVIFP